MYLLSTSSLTCYPNYALCSYCITCFVFAYIMRDIDMCGCTIFVWISMLYVYVYVCEGMGVYVRALAHACARVCVCVADWSHSPWKITFFKYSIDPLGSIKSIGRGASECDSVSSSGCAYYCSDNSPQWAPRWPLVASSRPNVVRSHGEYFQLGFQFCQPLDSYRVFWTRHIFYLLQNLITTLWNKIFWTELHQIVEFSKSATGIGDERSLHLDITTLWNMSCPDTSCHVYCVLPFVLCCVMLWCVVLCCVMSYCVTSCHAMSCHDIPQHGAE